MKKKINYRKIIGRQCKGDRSVKTGNLSNLVMVLKKVTTEWFWKEKRETENKQQTET